MDIDVGTIIKLYGQHEYILHYGKQKECYVQGYPSTPIIKELPTVSTVAAIMHLHDMYHVDVHVFDGVCRYIGGYAGDTKPTGWRELITDEGLYLEFDWMGDDIRFKHNVTRYRRLLAEKALFLTYRHPHWCNRENLQMIEIIDRDSENFDYRKYKLHTASPGFSIFATRLLPAGTFLPYLGREGRLMGDDNNTEYRVTQEERQGRGDFKKSRETHNVKVGVSMYPHNYDDSMFLDQGSHPYPDVYAVMRPNNMIKPLYKKEFILDVAPTDIQKQEEDGEGRVLISENHFIGSLVNEKSEDPIHGIYTAGLLLYADKHTLPWTNATYEHPVYKNDQMICKNINENAELTRQECFLLRDQLTTHLPYLPLLFNENHTVPFKHNTMGSFIHSTHGFIGYVLKKEGGQTLWPFVNPRNNFKTPSAFITAFEQMWERVVKATDEVVRDLHIAYQKCCEQKEANNITWDTIYEDMLYNVIMVPTNKVFYETDTHVYKHKTVDTGDGIKPIMYMMTRRDIQPGEELCTCYGYSTYIEKNKEPENNWKCSNVCYWEYGGIGPMWWKRSGESFSRALFNDDVLLA